MKRESSVHNIIENIQNNINKRHVIIIPKNISRRFLENILLRNNIKNVKILNLDEYIFELNNFDKNNLIKIDVAYLESALLETNSIFDKYNLTNETENIISIIDKIFIEKNIYIKSKNFNDEDIINNISINLKSLESKIFLEIFKYWIQKSITSTTYIGKYLELLNTKYVFYSDEYHHTLNIDEYEDIERNWINDNIPNNYNYNNSNVIDLCSDDFTPKNLNLYESYDFESQEDEIEFIAKDIEMLVSKNNNFSIALINNDRYFARRLRATLARKKISINDNNGWLLSTSSSCSYINSVIDYFVKNDNYINLHDIVKSPYFMNKISYSTKVSFLKNTLSFLKNNLNSSIEQNINLKNEDVFNIFLNFPNKNIEYKFEEFREIIEEKLLGCKSVKLLKNDSAGREFYNVLDYISNINKKNENKNNLETWHKQINSYLESRTFNSNTVSMIDYTDIKHALLYSYDKIYINSMSSKNFPKKIINNFSKNNIIYSELSMNSHEEQIESMQDFLNLSNNTDSILISSHISDGNNIYTKSRFKLLIDHFLGNYKNNFNNSNSNKIIKIDTGSKDTKLILDNIFLNLTYRDIENYNFCRYCFYFEKKSPRRIISSIEKNYSLFGSFVHAVLADFCKLIKDKYKLVEMISILSHCSDKHIDSYYLNSYTPYEINLWYKLLPTVADYFYYDINKKYNFSPEGKLYKKLNNGISLSGRYDLKYSCGNDSTIVDYKTGSIIPTKVSVTSGESLQLPFYTLLEPNTSIAEYLVINVSKGIVNKISFSSDHLENARDIILRTTDEISSNIKNKTEIVVKKSSQGCKLCGFENVNDN